ncbi:MAG: oligoribonuclease [Planctomycetota bacterium]
MPVQKRPIVWIDLEMSGLDPDRERILEIAVLVTNTELEIVAEGPDLVVHQDDALLEEMDAWNREHHGASGLTERVRASTVSERDAEEAVLSFLRVHCEEKTAPLAGNSVWQDRRFLARYMPRLESYLHYRIIDVSTLKELGYRWRSEVMEFAPKKKELHRAMEDIKESVEELRFYRTELFGL